VNHSDYFTISFNVPSTHADALRDVLGRSGAGKIGNYSYCSFSIRGTGRFKPSENANPYIGSQGVLEEVEEEKVETVCHKDILHSVIESIKSAHPYEEMVIDIYPVYEMGIKK